MGPPLSCSLSVASSHVIARTRQHAREPVTPAVTQPGLLSAPHASPSPDLIVLPSTVPFGVHVEPALILAPCCTEMHTALPRSVVRKGLT